MILCLHEAVVFLEGQRSAGLYHLLSGWVMLYKQMPDGRRQILSLLPPGGWFGGPGDDIHTCSAATLGDARILEVGTPQTDGRWTRQWREAAQTALASAYDRLTCLGRMTATEKVAWFLQELRPQLDGNDVPALPVAVIGDYLGLRGETVSRVLQQLRRKGVIHHQGAIGRGPLEVNWTALGELLATKNRRTATPRPATETAFANACPC